MKALSLMEPWAALIAAGVKSIETRSWRTAYRGPLYIHASRAKVDQKDPHIQRLLSLLPEGSLHPGFVVCRCVLKDCLPMDESFLGWIEAHPLEKLCGEYAPGRFAWVLEQMEPLEAPVAAGSQIGTLTVTAGEEIVAELPILAGEEIPRVTFGQMLARMLRTAFLCA